MCVCVYVHVCPHPARSHTPLYPLPPGGSYGNSADDCGEFLRRHAVLLASWPPLFLQQALNEPPHSVAHAWAQGLMGNGGPRGVVRLMNYDGESRPEAW